jgi:ribosome biogenesis GTPase
LIEDFGWSETLQHAFAPHAARCLEPGRVVVQQRGLYTTVTDHGELAARLSGRLANDPGEASHPAVGDWVALAARSAEGAATIHAVMHRRSAFVRKAAHTVQTAQVVAANVDVAFLVASMNADFNARRLERYLATAWQSGARPVVVLTKADLCAHPDAILDAAESVAIGAPVLAVSAVTGEGVEALAAHLGSRETGVLVGSSGVGKSTLVNALAGADLMATSAIREDDARGRHTTTHRELIRLPSGALILDTPGMRELGLLDADAGLDATFADIEALAGECRFRDCAHDTEPGCAVRAALESGELDLGRWKSFQKLGRELAMLERREDPIAREAHRRRWATVNRANRTRAKQRERW